MALATGITLPNDGDRIKAVNYNDPITKILAQLNGNIDSTNVASLSGSKITGGSLPVSALADDVAGGWFPSSDPLTYGSNTGNREFTVTIANADKTTKYSPGMRMKVTRATAPATKCMSFIAASSQSASKSSPTGIAFTTAFTCEAWIYLNSYTGSSQNIIARGDSPFQNGWFFRIDSTGRVAIGYASANNGTTLTSYQSVPLNRWVHVAGVITSVSGKTGAIYIDAATAPSSLTSSATTALTQAGDMAIGKIGSAGSDYFNGYISEVRVWPSAQTQSQIQANMAINLTGSEGMSALYRGDNNFNDLTSNANNLTANNGAVSSQASNPFNTIEYAIITKVAYSSPNTTLTVFTGTDCTIPNGTLSNFNFSTTRTPYGFPSGRNRWKIESIIRNDYNQSGTASGAWYNVGSWQIIAPNGDWRAILNLCGYAARAAGANGFKTTLSNANNTESDRRFTADSEVATSSDLSSQISITGDITATAPTTYYLNIGAINSATNALYIFGGRANCTLTLECAYL